MILCAKNRNFVFLHGLQEGRLSFRAGAIDFISEDELPEYRSFVKFKIATSITILFNDICAKYICRHQIGCKLDT